MSIEHVTDLLLIKFQGMLMKCLVVPMLKKRKKTGEPCTLYCLQYASWPIKAYLCVELMLAMDVVNSNFMQLLELRKCDVPNLDGWLSRPQDRSTSRMIQFFFFL